MATLTSALIVSLIDRASAPAKAIAASIKGIGAAVSAANNGGLAAMARTNGEALAAMHTRMLAATAAAYGLYKALSSPLSVAGQFESILLDIAQKSDLSDNAMAALGRRIREIGPTVNKTAQEVAQGMDVLTSMGLDPTRALAITPQLGKAATAYRAEMSDVARMTFAAIDNLKVPVTETAKLLDVLSQASKEGAFEFKDMARFFPVIAASAQAMGQKGIIGAARISAALETIRKGTGTAEEAATDLQNIFQKMQSPETTKKFAKLGIDIRAVLKKTMAEGGDVLEALAGATMKALGGDLTKIGDIFEDKQVQEGLRAFIQNWAEYRRIRKQALEASGVVDTDFDRRMKTFEAQVQSFRIQVSELGITIGSILMPHVNSLVAALRPMVMRFREFAEAHPVLVGNAIKAAAAIAGLGIATTAARWAFLAIRGAAIMVIRPVVAVGVAMATVAKTMLITPLVAGLTGAFRLLTAAVVGTAASFRTMAGTFMLLSGGSLLGSMRAGIAGLGAAFLAAANPVRIFAAAMHVLKLAVIGTGIGAILVAIAAAGLFIYNNWSGLGEFFSAFGTAFMAALGPLAPAVQPLIDGVRWLWDTVSGFFGEISPATWQEWGTAAGTAVGAVAASVLELPSRIASLASSLYNAGISAMQALWDGLKAKVGEIFGWLGSVVDSIAGKIDGIIPGWLRRMATPATPREKTTPTRPRRAGPRVIESNPDERDAAPPAPPRPPLVILGRSEPEQPEPQRSEPVIAPQADLSQIEAMTIAAAQAGSGLESLNGTVTPKVDTAPLVNALTLVNKLKAGLAEVGAMSVATGAAADRLRAGGAVNRAGRAQLSDFAHETGGG